MSGLKAHSEVSVNQIPLCNFYLQNMMERPSPVCGLSCASTTKQHGIGLGVGKGQRLVEDPKQCYGFIFDERQ